MKKLYLSGFWKQGRLILCLSGMILFISSCVMQRNIEYMQDKSNDMLSFNEAAIGEYNLKPGDELYIQINSLDDVTANVFGNTQQTLFMGTIQPYGASLISYTVDEEGKLILPVIGKINVEGMTVEQIRELITKSLENVLNQPVVSVKLVNRFVSVLGEVRNPGHFAYSQEKLTVFDAIGLAGDITDFGNRKEVVLTRNEDGKNIKINIDLTKSEVLASNYYFIRPNDIVYVKPLHRKFWGLNQFPYSVILSTITTAILLFSVTQ